MTATVSPRHFDVFNGDADGLCALHQLRLARPTVSSLVTGVKRDHALLGRIEARPGDTVTVLDLPLDPNRDALLKLLERGVAVEYFDHHATEPLAAHPRLQLTFDSAPGGCTSLLVNRHLHGRFAAWAAVGAFGDNLPATAEAMATRLGLSAADIQLLKALGECLNYNAYGDTEADLTIAPAELYKRMAPYANPLEFIEQEPVCLEIDRQWTEDRSLATTVKPLVDTASLIVVLLPDAAWARRVLGSHANRLADRHPGKLCTVLAPNSRKTLTISLRTPSTWTSSADRLVRPFGGGGRATAAGINDLPIGQLHHFIDHLRSALAVKTAVPSIVGRQPEASANRPGLCQKGDALLIVDVQNDFLPRGPLAVPAGDRVVIPLNQWIVHFSRANLPLFASRAWHPPDHCSFQSQGGPWPPHCVAETPGAAFAANLILPARTHIITRATRCDAEACSAFAGTDLDARLRSAQVRRLFVGGLATDHGILATVHDALHLGYQIILLRDAIRALDLEPGDGERAIAAMLAAGAIPAEN